MKPDTDGILIMRWDDWSQHPTWLTEKQHKERGLIPCGEPVAKVFYINKYIDGHYILLFDVEKGQPRPISDKKRAAMEKAKATAERNRTCCACGQLNATKIKRVQKLCDTCYYLQSEIDQARAWLADPNAVILDTETNELFGEILSIGCLEVVSGKVLLDQMIKPQAEIDETLYHLQETDWGEIREVPTAYAIHGISNEMVKDKPSFPEVWPSIQYAIEGKRVLIFNNTYDIECLRGDLSRHFIDYSQMQGSTECVMRWYTAYHGEWSRKYRDYKFIGLSQALREQDVAVDAEAHNALGDCQRTLALIKAIAAKKAPLDKETK